MSRFCWGAKGRERFGKARRKGSFRAPEFWTTPWCVWCGDRLFGRARTIFRCSALVARQFAFAIATVSARVTLIQLIPWFSLSTHWTYWTSEASSLKFGSCRLSQVLLRLWWSREMFGGAVADPFCHTLPLSNDSARSAERRHVSLAGSDFFESNMSGLSMSWRFKARWFALICHMMDKSSLKCSFRFEKEHWHFVDADSDSSGSRPRESHRVGTALRWQNRVGTAFEALRHA